MKSRIPASTNFSAFARNRGISRDAGRVLNATRRTLPADRAYRAAAITSSSSISYCARRRLHPFGPT
jgi:hypothetical protein